MKSTASRIALFVAIACLVAFPAVNSHAGIIPTITVTSGSGQHWVAPAATLAQAIVPLDGKGYEIAMPLEFPGIWDGLADVVIEELAFDPDPFVVNNILITNNTPATEDYTVLVTLPTTFPAPNIIFGEVHTAVIDSGGAPGATVATIPGTPIYAAQIDGVTVATLQDHPFSITAAPAGTANDTELFGPDPNFVPVTSSIGIELNFSLTAGDTAAILSRFDVVPEPSSGLLLLVATAFGAAFCRRRR